MMYAQVHPAVSMHIEDTMYSMWVVGVMSPYPMLVSVIRLQWRHTTYLGEEGGVGVVSTSMEESRTIECVFLHDDKLSTPTHHIHKSLQQRTRDAVHGKI